MNENQEEEERIDSEEEEEMATDDYLKAYLAEMENLETDFSDLESLDMDELIEMQDAIAAVKQGEIPSKSELISDDNPLEILEDTEREFSEQKEAMIMDFSDIGEMDLDDLREMKEAIEGVKLAEGEALTKDGETQPQQQVLSVELEERLKAELAKKKEEEAAAAEIITEEKFIEYCKNKRDKIWYHALWHLTFNIEDHIASKSMLYEVLKEVTSKSALDPIPEHQFYFGLGYLLRLNINNKQVIRYMAGGKFKVNINIKNLMLMLQEAGEPISRRPVIEEGEKKKMFADFLKDDFLDI